MKHKGNTPTTDMPIWYEKLLEDIDGSKVYVAHGYGEQAMATYTSHMFENGEPMLKYFDRMDEQGIETPTGEFFVLESELYWYYKHGPVWVRVDREKYGRPMFDY